MLNFQHKQPNQFLDCHGQSKKFPKIPIIRFQVLGQIKRPFKASNQPKHYKTLKQSVTLSRIKPLPHGVCRKLPKPVTTCSPRCVEPLCFLVRRNPTDRSAVNLERSCSLSKKNQKSNLTVSIFPSCTFGLFFFFPFPFLFSYEFFSFVFIPPFCFSLLLFLISFFSFPFIFSQFPPFFLHFSPPFWSIDRKGQKEEVSSPLPQDKCVAFHFPSFIPYFFISFMTSCSHVTHCEPWDSFPHMTNCEPFL